MIKKLFDFFQIRNKLVIFFMLFLVDIMYTFVISYVVNWYNPSLLDVFDPDLARHKMFVITVIVGPLLETFLFQFLIIEILLNFKFNSNVIIWISAILFASSHFYNAVYVLIILFPGILYASYYLYLKEQKGSSTFLIISALHGASNLVVFVFEEILWQ